MREPPARSPGLRLDPAAGDLPEAAANKAHYVYPGQILVSATPMQATTILGTCISVCLFDAQLGIGGLNHFLLPQAPAASGAPGRFGDAATALLVDELLRQGADRRRLEAKVFGGTAGALDGPSLARDLGARNLAAALAALAAERIPVIGKNVGGRQSRKLLFSTGDGRAWVRFF